MVVRITIAFAITLSLVMPVASQDNIMVIGDIDCGSWVKARTQNRSQGLKAPSRSFKWYSNRLGE